ncbi:hypothetical protein [Mycetocola zhujimingii]|uniref:Uncharacterized protein n=1 Tax=Mycetocola zhujimingii TaxID=2079792 RepID=A0A2U1TAU7_9MICO|nr:hypothetical protein [Mycetocola zhujimingii]AWB85202.1 hypothetical protein C3E77_00095 [Mycetocola zhujimingii]PWC05996.1 hypothetical protein DF223_13225 [Mycetocola zhujimingii]
MTQTSTGTDDASTTDRVREAGGHVASTAADGASNVKQEVGTQAKNLVGEVRSQLTTQVSTQQERAAGGIRTMSEQLRSMADSSETSGVATSLVSQAASRAEGVAGWLESRDPAGLLDDVKSFARRRPGVFIAAAAGAGIVVGRLAKSLAAGNDDSTSTSSSATTVTPQASTQTFDAAPPATDLGYVAPPAYSDTPTYADTATEYGDSGDVR